MKTSISVVMPTLAVSEAKDSTLTTPHAVLIDLNDSPVGIIYGHEWGEAEELARLCARAVNSHDALVRALEALEPYLTTEAQMLDSASLNEGRASKFDVASVKAREALARVRT